MQIYKIATVIVYIYTAIVALHFIILLFSSSTVPRQNCSLSLSLFSSLFLLFLSFFLSLSHPLSLSSFFLFFHNTLVDKWDGDDMGSLVCWEDLESLPKVTNQSYWWIGFLGFCGSSCWWVLSWSMMAG